MVFVNRKRDSFFIILCRNLVYIRKGKCVTFLLKIATFARLGKPTIPKWQRKTSYWCYIFEPPTYDNLKHCSLYEKESICVITANAKDSFSNPPTNNINLTFCVVNGVWKAPLCSYYKEGRGLFLFPVLWSRLFEG